MKKDNLEEPVYWVNEPQMRTPNYDIYKIIPLRFFLKWVESKKIRFDQIVKWEADVYELFLFKQKYYSQVNGQTLPVDMNAVNHAIYGQSWSLQKESDALWRIYSPEFLSVKIHTTTGKLIEEMQKCALSNSHWLAYMGRVKYYSMKGLQNQMAQYHKNGVSNETTMVYSLFDKRTALSFEKEFRIVILQATQTQPGNNKVSLPIYPFIQLDMNPVDFIDEVVFDYRLDDNLFNGMKCCLQKILPKVSINRSSLGKFTPKSYNI